MDFKRVIQDALEDNGVFVDEKQLDYMFHKTIIGIKEMLQLEKDEALILIANAKTERYFVIQLKRFGDDLGINPDEIDLNQFLDLIGEAKKEGHDIKPEK